MVSSRTVTGRESPEFARALDDLHRVRLRPEIRLTEVPAPQRIAPYAVALTADVVDPHDTDDDLASGRFVLLHDPSAPEPWGGEWRAVTFARAELEPELATDPLLGEVGWSWLTDALATRGVGYVAEAGTVTRVVSQSFAGLADRPASVEMEVRASWTPLGPEVGEHLLAWSDLLCTIAGLPPSARGCRRPARTPSLNELRDHGPSPRGRHPAARPCRSTSPPTASPSSSRPSVTLARAADGRRATARARSRSTPSAPRATATASAPTSCRCAARVPAPG